jgi:hypothetical protein
MTTFTKTQKTDLKSKMKFIFGDKYSYKLPDNELGKLAIQVQCSIYEPNTDQDIELENIWNELIDEISNKKMSSKEKRQLIDFWKTSINESSKNKNRDLDKMIQDFSKVYFDIIYKNPTEAEGIDILRLAKAEIKKERTIKC